MIGPLRLVLGERKRMMVRLLCWCQATRSLASLRYCLDGSTGRETSSLEILVLAFSFALPGPFDGVVARCKIDVRPANDSRLVLLAAGAASG
jgi:hypothetical protein